MCVYFHVYRKLSGTASGFLTRTFVIESIESERHSSLPLGGLFAFNVMLNTSPSGDLSKFLPTHPPPLRMSPFSVVVLKPKQVDDGIPGSLSMCYLRPSLLKDAPNIPADGWVQM